MPLVENEEDAWLPLVAGSEAGAGSAALVPQSLSMVGATPSQHPVSGTWQQWSKGFAQQGRQSDGPLYVHLLNQSSLMLTNQCYGQTCTALWQMR
jgi:hypothetical protein